MLSLLPLILQIFCLLTTSGLGLGDDVVDGTMEVVDHIRYDYGPSLDDCFVAVS